MVLAGRDEARGHVAARALREATGAEKVVHRRLGLGSLESVTTWARRHSAMGKPLHILVLNAGVMETPLTRTADGFELQFAVNHLGHFAFTAGLLPSRR